MKINGVIFDFNGTLFWDTELHDHAWDTFFRKHKINLSSREKDEKIHGKNNRDILNGLFGRELHPEEIREFSKEKEDIYQELCMKEKMELAPGAVEFFEFLQQKDIPFTIATAANKYNVDFYFQHLPLEAHFDRSKVVFDDGSMNSKPDPEIFRKAMKKIAVRAEEVIIFEDSASGVAAAENAGAGLIIVVESVPGRHGKWNYPVIRDFAQVDRSVF